MSAPSPEKRLWGPLILLHVIGLPLALALGFVGNLLCGPMAGAALAVLMTFFVIGIGIWHAVRVFLAADLDA